MKQRTTILIGVQVEVNLSEHCKNQVCTIDKFTYIDMSNYL